MNARATASIGRPRTGESSLHSILDQQVAWATRANKHLTRAYLPAWQENLYQPLSPAARTAFEAGGGQELGRAGDSRPAKMAALRSSSALAVNFFDPLTTAGLDAVRKAMNLEAAVVGIEFERKFPHGLPTQPPNLDVTLALANGETVGVESKFTEPYPRSETTCCPPLRAAYFEDDEGRWATLGLPRCQSLAESVGRTELFHQLDAAQLLKHILGLGRCSNPSGRPRLIYLWYACSHPDSRAHAAEVQRFAQLLDDKVGFQALTYQELYRTVRDALEPGHCAYLEARYFFEAVA